MPPSVNSVVPRPRVEKILRDALESSPIVLLQAPFGYGKTTLVETALRRTGGAAFFRVQPWHHGNFVEDLVLAVRTARPDFGRRTLGGVEAQADSATLARLFLADLRHLPSLLYIAIDNAEHVTDDAAFTEFLETLASDVPEHVRLLLSGRTLPRLAATTLVRAGAITIPPDALLFSEEELGAALEAHGTRGGDDAVDSIARATNGWAASVSLALRARSANLAQDSEEIGLRYVSETLFSELDEDTRTFLGRVCVFERIDRGVLEHEASYGDVERLLSNIENAGAPLTREQSAYALHPLVRAVALKELERSGHLPEAHALAARAFAHHGSLPAALFHIYASGDEAAADSFMRSYGASIVRTGNHKMVRDALNLLRSPNTQDVRAYTEGLLTKSEGTAESERLFVAASASDDPKIAFAAHAERIERTIARNGSAEPAALDNLERRADGLGPDARARAAIFRSWSNAIAFDFDGALAILEPFRDLDDAGARFNTGVLYAYARASRGDTDVALAELDALVRLFENDDRVIFEALTLIWQARIALLAGRITVAGDASRAALRLTENLSIRAEEAALYFALAELATNEGHVALAVAFAERLSATAPNAWYSGDSVRARAFAETALARAAFLGTDVSTALDLALRSAANDGFPSVQRAVAYAEAAAYARLLDDDRANLMYRQARSFGETAEPRDAADAVALSTALDILSFLGAVFSWEPPPSIVPQLAPFRRLLEVRRGLVTMDHAAIALRNLREGKATQEPFNAALAQISREGPRFEVHLLRAFAPRDRAVETPLAPTLDLTARELEILTLLVEGLSNKEIAQRLILSPRTVETHVERVLGKLDVGSRSRAIAKALRLGLVDLTAI